ncbi:MAG: poly(U)-specific 3'-to-5' RNA exonuclease [Bathelium mastoideum]|nr:MAG: poly(U)-specific 3'-to-5' RNA exonuclease [Bathelium mastoideum]
MKLVGYPDSDSDDDAETESQDQETHLQSGVKKRRRLGEVYSDLTDDQEPDQRPPPVLSDIHFRRFYDLYTTEPRVSAFDDPNLHGGRKRITPHVAGNWPSHVYLEWVPTPTECEPITSILSNLEAAADACPSSTDSSTPLEPIHPLHVDKLDAAATPRRLHISLSTTLNIQTEQRHEFLEQMANTVKADPFRVRFMDLQWVSNYDGSRWFLVLKCEEHTAMQQLLDRTNSVAARFGQNLLYQQDHRLDHGDQVSVQSEPVHPTTEVSGVPVGEAEDLDGQPSLWTTMTDRRKRKEPSVLQHSGKSGDPNNSRNSGEDETTNESLPFHVSIAWTLDRPPSPLYSPMTIPAIKAIMAKDMMRVRPLFERVKVKVGDQVTSLPLGNLDLGDRYIWENGERIRVPRFNQDTDRNRAASRHMYNVRYGHGSII